MPSRQEFVSIEELCAWIESGVWRSFRDSTFVGFSLETLSEVLAKHSEERIRLSGLVDGVRQPLHPDVENDFQFEIVWECVADAYLVGSRGNCVIRGHSRHVFRPEKLADLSCRDNMGWQTPSPTAEGGTVHGFHCVISNIRIKKQEAYANWHSGGGRSDCASKEVEQCHPSESRQEQLAALFARKGFHGIALIARERELKIEAYLGKPEPFTATIHPGWVERARQGDAAFDSLNDDQGYARLKKRCERFLKDVKDNDIVEYFRAMPIS
jgi:hypothetical protein